MATAENITRKVFAGFNSANPDMTLPVMCSDLFAKQKLAWQQMTAGYASLEYVHIRRVICNGFTVEVQYNPKRIISAEADVEPAQRSKRLCFLCYENLPEEQQGILYRDTYLILCNPVPIFPKHFTISSIHHTPQGFESSLEPMLDLVRDLCPDYSVFYNGPECGASAPDHLHLQAGPRRALPVEWDAVDARRRKRFYYKNHVAGFTLMNCGRAVLIVESSDKNQLLAFIRTMVGEWKNLLHRDKEPMMNVICSFQEEIWRFIIFPRYKHRPEVYFKGGDDRVIISPGAVDMGGLVVTPVEKDFIGIDAKLIEDIFTEVSEKQEFVESILEKLV